LLRVASTTLTSTISRNTNVTYIQRQQFPPSQMISISPTVTSPHQDSTSTAPSGTPPPAQPPTPPQTRGTQSHSAPTPLKRPISQVWETVSAGGEGAPGGSWYKAAIRVEASAGNDGWVAVAGGERFEFVPPVPLASTV